MSGCEGWLPWCVAITAVLVRGTRYAAIASSRCQHTSTHVKNLSKVSNTQKSTRASVGAAFWASTSKWRLTKIREYPSFSPGFEAHLYGTRHPS